MDCDVDCDMICSTGSGHAAWGLGLGAGLVGAARGRRQCRTALAAKKKKAKGGASALQKANALKALQALDQDTQKMQEEAQKKKKNGRNGAEARAPVEVKEVQAPAPEKVVEETPPKEGKKVEEKAKPISWTLCRSTLEELLTVILSDAAEAAIDANPDHVRLLRKLADPRSWPFLSAVHPASATGPPSLNTVDEIISHAVVASDIVVVPRPVGRERVFLHAFSGRRRPGDLQHYLESAFHRDADQGGLTLHVVSMDVVIDPCWGDARRKSTQRFWLEGVLAGYVLGGLCGPPCETWSQARFHEVQMESGRGPRPLRSADELWGLASMSLRELCQVEVGNDLLLFSLELILCLAISGGFGVLEHPSEPSEEDRPSIWKLAIVHLLLQLPGIDSFMLAQGLLGARTPKPTRLLTVNMPDLPRHIQQHRICPDLPKRIAIGRQEDSSWATAGLKEYPPALNRAWRSVLYRIFSGDLQIPPPVLKRHFYAVVSPCMQPLLGTTSGVIFTTCVVEESAGH
eukprot:s1097_g8.t1